MYAHSVEATRLATRFLQDHAKDGHFAVWIDPSQDLELVAQRLKEKGCSVDIDPKKRILEVDPPRTN